MHSQSQPPLPSPEQRIRHYRWMLQARLLEEQLRNLYRQGKVVGGVYLGLGQEALSAACGMCLQPGDVYGPLIRDLAGRLAFGEPLGEAARSYFGKRSGWMRGRDGNVHRGKIEAGILPMISHLGSLAAPVAGMLLARRLRGETGSVGLTCIGDGGISTGAMHEAINVAAIQRLPLVVVVANNGYAYSTGNAESFACADLLDRAAGYGVAGSGCDGTDPQACLQTIAAAIDAARAGGGVQMVVVRFLRLSGHGEHDDARYITQADKDRFADCLAVGAAQMAELGVTEAELGEWRAQLRQEIVEACDLALADPDPDPSTERWSAYAGTWPFAVEAGA